MTDQPQNPSIVVIRGKLAVDSGEIYGKYLEASKPIAEKYDAKVVTVGDAIIRDYLDVTLPLNIVVSFDTEEQCDGYFLDSDYVEIKEKYRDPSYEELRILVFRASSPIAESDAECVVASFANLIPGTENQYKEYLQGVLEIAPKFGLSLLVGGEGLDKSYADPGFTINSLLTFPTADESDAFFNNPDYLKIAEKRQASYTDAELGMFKPRILNLD
jgi:uncharacterized protein (DUF1330 family)|tara:strand:+ start:18922 stop:19569 length:648 start_codon:yes stop_codon:yes gene_type:complete